MDIKAICKILFAWIFIIGYITLVINVIKLLPDIRSYNFPDVMILFITLFGPWIIWWIIYWIYEKCRNNEPQNVNVGYEQLENVTTNKEEDRKDEKEENRNKEKRFTFDI